MSARLCDHDKANDTLADSIIYPLSAAERSRMRLQAALCLLKLARRAAYDSSIGREFARLAFATQDECFQVRARFLHALLKDLARRRLSPRYNALCFLVAFDPERENREMVSLELYTERRIGVRVSLTSYTISTLRRWHIMS